MNTIINGRVFIYFFLVGLLVYFTMQGYENCSPVVQQNFKEVINVVIIAAYCLVRVALFIVSCGDVKFGHEYLIFGKILNAEDLKEGESLIILIPLNVVNFMPIYFLAYAIRKLWLFPWILFKKCLTWADTYLTIKAKNHES